MQRYMNFRGAKKHSDKTLMVLSPSAYVYNAESAKVREQKFSTEKEFCNDMEKHIIALAQGQTLPKADSKGLIKMKTLGGQEVEFANKGNNTYLVSYNGIFIYFFKVKSIDLIFIL
jgi:hypothetical protein